MGMSSLTRAIFGDTSTINLYLMELLRQTLAQIRDSLSRHLDIDGHAHLDGSLAASS